MGDGSEPADIDNGAAGTFATQETDGNEDDEIVNTVAKTQKVLGRLALVFRDFYYLF